MNVVNVMVLAQAMSVGMVLKYVMLQSVQIRLQTIHHGQ